jgi:hypothetical protein
MRCPRCPPAAEIHDGDYKGPYGNYTDFEGYTVLEKFLDGAMMDGLGGNHVSCLFSVILSELDTRWLLTMDTWGGYTFPVYPLQPHPF